jgi:hypothetical protein
MSNPLHRGITRSMSTEDGRLGDVDDVVIGRGLCDAANHDSITQPRRTAVSRLLRLDHASESEIDAAVDSRRGFWYSMEPEALSFACHYEPMPLLQFKRDCFLRSLMSELKPPRSTERQARYCWAISKIGLTIAVPPDTVTAMPKD